MEVPWKRLKFLPLEMFHEYNEDFQIHVEQLAAVRLTEVSVVCASLQKGMYTNRFGKWHRSIRQIGWLLFRPTHKTEKPRKTPSTQ